MVPSLQNVRQDAPNESFRLLVESIDDYAIVSVDLDGRVQTWNRGAERIFGYTASEAVGTHFSTWYVPDERASGKPEADLRRAREHGRFSTEVHRQRKDGSRFLASVVLTAIYDEAHELRGFACVTREAAAQATRELPREALAHKAATQAEERVLQERERYKAVSKRLETILEGVADGITLQDRAGKVLFANSAAAHLCGFSSANDLMEAEASELVDRFELFDERGQPFARDDLPGQRALDGAPSPSALLQVHERSSGRRFWVSIRASAVCSATRISASLPSTSGTT